MVKYLAGDYWSPLYRKRLGGKTPGRFAIVLVDRYAGYAPPTDQALAELVEIGYRLIFVGGAPEKDYPIDGFLSSRQGEFIQIKGTIEQHLTDVATRIRQ